MIRYAYYMTNDADKRAVPLLRAVLALGRRLRSERPEGALTLSAISLLGTLGRRGPMPAVQLAAEEHLQPQSLTRLISRLERDGLIERRRSAADRRALVIALTENGKAVLAADLNARRRWLQKAMSTALTEEERAGLATAARAMLKLAFHERDAPE